MTHSHAAFQPALSLTSLRPFVSNPIISKCCRPSPLARRATARSRRALVMVDLDPIFSATFHAESIFETYSHPLPTGTADLARARNIPMQQLSTAYGHILAKNILNDIPATLNHALIASSCRTAMTSTVPVDALKFDTHLSSVRSTSGDESGKRAESLSTEQVDEFSSMYGHILGRTVRMAALELDPEALSEGLLQRLNDAESQFPMPDAEYDLAFDNLQDCAADVLGTSNVDAADIFFKSLKANEAVTDVQGDGYILCVQGMSCKEDEDMSREAKISDTVHVVLRVRLLDGRTLVLPMYDEDEPQYVEFTLDQVPPALGSGIVDMKAGDCRTLFYHPYAACEILSLFVADQMPPQSGLVVDVRLKRIV